MSEAAIPVVETTKRTVKMSEMALMLAEFARNQWHVVTPPHVTVKDILGPSFFDHVATKLKEFDIIDIFSAVHKFYLKAYVVSSKNGSVTIRLLESMIEGDGLESKTLDVADFEVKSSSAGWRVIRKNDKTVIRSGFSTEGEASKWLTEEYTKGK